MKAVTSQKRSDMRTPGSRNVLFGAATAVLLTFAAVAIPANASSGVNAPRQPVSWKPLRLIRSAVPLVEHAAKIASLAPNQSLAITVSLRGRDEQGLQTFLSQLYDPGSPSYHHFLTAAQFETRFGPSQGASRTVIAWLQSKGLAIFNSIGSTIRARGSVS